MVAMTIDERPAPVTVRQGLPPCRIRASGAEIRRIADLPASVAAAMDAAAGGVVAEAGQPFHATDIAHRDAPPGVRFLRAYRVRDLWLVWVERGGIAHRYDVLGFRDAPHGMVTAVPANPGRMGLCAASRRLAAAQRR